jgi:hypothetical protein
MWQFSGVCKLVCHGRRGRECSAGFVRLILIIIGQFNHKDKKENRCQVLNHDSTIFDWFKTLKIEHINNSSLIICD